MERGLKKELSAHPLNGELLTRQWWLGKDLRNQSSSENERKSIIAWITIWINRSGTCEAADVMLWFHLALLGLLMVQRSGPGHISSFFILGKKCKVEKHHLGSTNQPRQAYWIHGTDYQQFTSPESMILMDPFQVSIFWDAVVGGSCQAVPCSAVVKWQQLVPFQSWLH